MQFVGKVISSVSEFYRDINPSTLSGAIDVVVVENVETGELACSPFHVRFGKLQLLRPQEKAVELKINGVGVGEELRMKVGEAGETFFVLPKEELGWGGGSDLPLEYLTSPLVGPETPAPIESIEEFKLEKRGGDNILSSNPSNPIIPAETPVSPEWKWKWGDLPMKKDTGPDEIADSIMVNSVGFDGSVSTSTTANVTANSDIIHCTSTSTQPTVELYEYLAGKDYLMKAYESLARFPARSMITRIYRIDRGLHFNPASGWPEQLTSPAFLNESLRLLESDFLVNPNVVIEESSRLVYQFTWENRKIVLSGSVGAAVVFYAQTYARILPLEIILKLAEIATIRMAKRKFSKSLTTVEEDEEAAAAVDKETVKAENISVSEAPTTIVPETTVTSSQAQSITQKSSWRSWWTRSAGNSVGNSVGNSLGNSNASDPVPVPVAVTNINSASNSNSTTPSSPNSPSTSSPSPVPMLVVSPEPDINTNSVIKSPTKMTEKMTEPPPSLSTLIDSNASQMSSSGSITVESPTKRIIQRTASLANAIEITTTVGALNDLSAIASAPSSPVSKVGVGKAAASKQYIKSLRLPSHLLKRLNLKPGVNTISYTVNTKLQGTATCQSRIFLWRSDARVVISDIDGTITKSDALGHLFTMVGKDWTHVGVAQLYSKIAANGYEFLYLTSRAIGQAASTRGYLKGVEQDRLQLPDGPVIMSPDRLFTALHREVIQRRPDEFKIACLRDIQKLFVNDEEEVSMMGSGIISSSEDEYTGVGRGNMNNNASTSTITTAGTSTSTSTGTSMLRLPNGHNQTQTTSHTPHTSPMSNTSTVTIHQNPFYAGFGNRPTDTKSYKAVGISASRIFLINPAGDLKLDKLTFYTPYSASSYSKLTEEVDKVFPPVRSPSSLTRVAGDEAFTDFQYWHGLGGGDVRMDLVQMALGGLKRKVDALIDENGKPVSPRQIGFEGSVSNSSSNTFYNQSSEYSSTVEMLMSPGKSVSTPPALPPRRKSAGSGDYANDADSEEEEESDGDEEEELIDSFPFI